MKKIDNKLIIASLKGSDSENAFELIYQHYYQALCACIVRLVTKEEAECIVQETMM